MPRPAALSPVWLVLGGILSVQFGAAIAKDLFDRIDPTALVWLRLVTSAVVVTAVARPTLRGRSRDDWWVALAFGASLGIMNWAIYQSFARIPLGLAVTIEFVGPLALAVIGSRRPRDLLWVALAAAGVGLLGLEPGALTTAGVVLALVAGAAWAAYILLSARTGARWPGLDGLAVASVVATLLITPFAVTTGGEDLLDPTVLALGALVGLLSSVVPYSLELIALRSMSPRVLSILMSLEPAAAALAGALLLRELLGPVQLLAIACVVAASVGMTRSAGSGEFTGSSQGLTPPTYAGPSVDDIIPPHHRELRMFVPLPAALALSPRAVVDRWAISAQLQARRNAMIAATALAQRRHERLEVEEFLTARLAPPSEEQHAARG